MKADYKIFIIYLLLLVLLVSLGSCQTRSYVITEYDGDREIRWHSDKKNY